MTDIDPRFMISLRDLALFLNVSPQSIHKTLKQSNLISILHSNKTFLPPSTVRRILESKGYSYSFTIIAIEMLKGGVGKTSSVINIATRATHYGAKVLCIDLDQQANLTFGFGISEESYPTWIDIIEGNCQIKDTLTLLVWCKNQDQ